MITSKYRGDVLLGATGSTYNEFIIEWKGAEDEWCKNKKTRFSYPAHIVESHVYQ